MRVSNDPEQRRAAALVRWRRVGDDARRRATPQTTVHHHVGHRTLCVAVPHRGHDHRTRVVDAVSVAGRDRTDGVRPAEPQTRSLLPHHVHRALRKIIGSATGTANTRRTATNPYPTRDVTHARPTAGLPDRQSRTRPRFAFQHKRPRRTHHTDCLLAQPEPPNTSPTPTTTTASHPNDSPNSSTSASTPSRSGAAAPPPERHGRGRLTWLPQALTRASFAPRTGAAPVRAPRPLPRLPRGVVPARSTVRPPPGSGRR